MKQHFIIIQIWIILNWSDFWKYLFYDLWLSACRRVLFMWVYLGFKLKKWSNIYVTPVLQAFAGNSNTESVVRHDLQNPIVARYLRIIPLDWSEEGRIGLRFEIYGCPYCKCCLHCHIPHRVDISWDSIVWELFIWYWIYDAEAYGDFHPNNYALFFYVAKSLL